MRKFITFAASSLALFGAQVASADTYTPAGTWTFRGNAVQVQKGTGPLLTCRLTITATVPNAAGDAHGSGSHGHTATATASFSGSTDIRCLTVSFTTPPSPYTVDYDPATNLLTLQNVYADTTITPGDCSGNIGGTWTGTGLNVNATLPQVTSGGACTVVGNLTLISPVGGTITG